MRGRGGENKQSKLIHEDQKNHPNCQYSQSYKSICSNKSGKYNCENLAKVIRHCPGQRPVEIYNESENGQGNGTEFGNEKDEGFGFDSDSGENIGKFLDGFFNFGGGRTVGSFPSSNIDSFLNDFFQMSQFPPSPQDQLDPFKDFTTPSHSREENAVTAGAGAGISPRLIPPHKIPKGQLPLEKPQFKLDDLSTDPPPPSPLPPGKLK